MAALDAHAWNNRSAKRSYFVGVVHMDEIRSVCAPPSQKLGGYRSQVDNMPSSTTDFPRKQCMHGVAVS
jgi:hypothetical protein